MIKIMKIGEVAPEEIFARAEPKVDVESIVAGIIADVKANGDKALYAYAKKFDKADLKSLRVSEEELQGEGLGQNVTFGRGAGSTQWEATEPKKPSGMDDPAERRQRVLSEMNGRKIPVWLLTAEKDRGEDPGYVFLFQPVDQILARLGEVIGTAPKVVGEPATAAECRCTGVITLDGTNSSATALQLARRFAVKSKTILLCVNPWPEGGRDWKPAESDVSELLYLLKEYGRDWYRHERFCLRAAGNVKIISGYSCFSDYGQFADEDAEAFIAGLEGAGYEALIIDFGASPHPVLAENCEELYVVGSRSGERYSTLERMLREDGLEDRLRPADAAAVG